MKIIDLFCGCGGMSLGFQNAGFNVVNAFDFWDCAIECYSSNLGHPATKLDLSDAVSSIEIIKNKKPDIIIGGPPCQDFSTAGNRCEGYRANLTLSFAHIVAAVKPHFFVMENVVNVSKSETYNQAVKLFRKAGYGITEKTLDASYCGVPQKRKRFFCIGELNGNDGFLESILSINQSLFPLTIREYFESEGHDLLFEYYYRHPRSYTRRAIFSINESSPTIRGVNRPKPKEYIQHPGDLEKPENIRSLTYLERSMIQTFPKNYCWSGSLADIEQMIGNAVPVKLSQFVAECLFKYIRGETNSQHIEFIDWLVNEKKSSTSDAGNILNRVGRAHKILDSQNYDFNTYIIQLSSTDKFLNIIPSVRSQIKSSLKLYFEYLSL